MIHFSRRSLTLRLTALFAAASTAILIGVGYLFATSMDVHFQHQDAMELQGKTELVRHILGRVHIDTELAALQDKLQDALVGHDGLFISVRDPVGKRLFASSQELLPVESPTPGAATHVVAGIPITTQAVGGHLYRVANRTVVTGAASVPQADITVAMNIDHHRQFMDAMQRTAWGAVAVGAILSALLAWFAAHIGLIPVRALARLTRNISARQLHTRVDTGRLPPELHDLGESFNDMLSRLEVSFRRLNEFSSDLAHELRTPISNLITQSQVALSRSRSADDYREVIYSAIEEYERLARMVGDMLFLAKADNGLLIPGREKVDLRAEVDALFEFYDALVDDQGIKLVVHGNGSVLGDRIMLRRALSNLLSNAIRHTPRGSDVTVSIAESGTDEVSVAVSNPGASISPDHLPRIFDRFYRVDPSRQRSTEGAGLGLAITRTIITAHGGTIKASSDANATRFEIQLPRIDSSKTTAARVGAAAVAVP